jgi:hypothetical protein
LSSEEERVLALIRTRGYWRVEIRPSDFIQRFSLDDCRRTIEQCQVKLRGWYYPHISHRTNEYFSGNNYVTGFVDWQDHKEAWRFYQSGQFIHYFAMVEDWWSETRGLFGEPIPGAERYPPSTAKEIILTLYNLTEITTLASRLMQLAEMSSELVVALNLDGVQDRTLMYYGPSPGTLAGEYTCRINEISIRRELTETQISDYNELGVELTREIFARFNWHNPDLPNILRTQQERLVGPRSQAQQV